jgi:hypothetical protein
MTCVRYLRTNKLPKGSEPMTTTDRERPMKKSKCGDTHWRVRCLPFVRDVYMDDRLDAVDVAEAVFYSAHLPSALADYTSCVRLSGGKRETWWMRTGQVLAGCGRSEEYAD